MEVREIDKKRMSTPGPGEYSHDPIAAVGKQGVKVSIGSARRSIEGLKLVPCPTNYSPDHNSIKMRHPAFTMGKSAKRLEGGIEPERTPGPAHYPKKFVTKRGPIAVIPQGKRDMQRSYQKLPGPADYSNSMFQS